MIYIVVYITMEITLTFGYGDVFVLGVFTGAAFCFIAWLIRELKD